jgi:outer membrane protein assembly factor BamB
MKMEILKNKTKISAITFVLLLTIFATLVALPTATAHDPPWTVQNFVFISAIPNRLGVSQQTTIVFWPNNIPPTAEGASGDRWTWNVEVTKPDNSKQTLGPFTSDPVGGGWTTYTPTQVGTYTFVATVEEHTITGLPLPPDKTIETIRNAASVNDTYMEATSDPTTIIVQEDPIEAWIETPLPTEYWARPINSINREWYVLAGNWLAGAAQNVGPTARFSYGLGPESAHIMWSTPYWAGGIMDQRFSVTGYQTGHYEGLYFSPPIILDGKIYYNIYSLPMEGWRVLDLYTGEELWFHNTTGPVSDIGGPMDGSGNLPVDSLLFGQILEFECPNQHGGFPYLWTRGLESNTLKMFDAFTGSYICSINNVPGMVMMGQFQAFGTTVYGKDGSILVYNLEGQAPNQRLTCWNTTRAIWYEETWTGNEYWMWRPTLNETFDGNNGYSLNVSIPNVSGGIQVVREGEFVIGGIGGSNYPDKPLELGNLWALSLKAGEEGKLLWNITFTPPRSTAESTSYRAGFSGPYVDPEDGVFLFSERISRRWWGYNLETGNLLWGPTESEAQMNYYEMTYNIYQGKLLSTGYSGELIAYNITTGEKLWTYTAPSVGFESPYGNYPLLLSCIADGKIYVVSGEHSPTQPLWRGAYLRCIDADNGEEIWKVLHWGNEMGGFYWGVCVVAADGYVVGLNLYDNQIYCYGKGPSSTTVTASPKFIAEGASVVIEGAVRDESPGTNQLEIAARFPNGVPAIADEYMNEWMEYLYVPRPIPEDAKGVEVTLDAVDPNGNFIHIDTVTSDISGLYSCIWTPEHEGKYTIIATFEGSKAYYCSYSETAIGVGPAPAPSGPIEPEPTEPEEAPFITTEIAILIAVVVVAVIGIAAYWVLRKRK